LETLECALRLAEIHGKFLKFRAVDLDALNKGGRSEWPPLPEWQATSAAADVRA
jgi:hypothetical protein